MIAAFWIFIKQNNFFLGKYLIAIYLIYESSLYILNSRKMIGIIAWIHKSTKRFFKSRTRLSFVLKKVLRWPFREYRLMCLVYAFPNLYIYVTLLSCKHRQTYLLVETDSDFDNEEPIT
jgi:hypothetical protein